MTDAYASGNWHVQEGKEDTFVERWQDWLGWTRKTHPNLERARLIRDRGDPRHFVSFAEWEDAASRDAWKQSPEFAEKFGACRKLCDDFYGGDYDEAGSI